MTKVNDIVVLTVEDGQSPHPIVSVHRNEGEALQHLREWADDGSLLTDDVLRGVLAGRGIHADITGHPVPDALPSFDQLANQRGWSYQTQAGLLRAFITEEELDDQLDDFARNRAELDYA